MWVWMILMKRKCTRWRRNKKSRMKCLINLLNVLGFCWKVFIVWFFCFLSYCLCLLCCCWIRIGVLLSDVLWFACLMIFLNMRVTVAVFLNILMVLYCFVLLDVWIMMWMCVRCLFMVLVWCLSIVVKVLMFTCRARLARSRALFKCRVFEMMRIFMFLRMWLLCLGRCVNFRMLFWMLVLFCFCGWWVCCWWRIGLRRETCTRNLCVCSRVTGKFWWVFFMSIFFVLLVYLWMFY